MDRFVFSFLLIVWVPAILCDLDVTKIFHQHDYKLRNMRIDVPESYNKDLLNKLEIKTFKYNRTTTAFNITVNTKVNMSKELEVIVQAYKFLSNEYRIFPAVRLRTNYCKAVLANYAGVLSNLNCGNLNTSDCFVQKEKTYVMCNFAVDESLFPPLIPHGEFKLQVEVLYKNIKITTINAYAEVYRPIPYPKH